MEAAGNETSENTQSTKNADRSFSEWNLDRLKQLHVVMDKSLSSSSSAIFALETIREFKKNQHQYT